jgi:hypothetical protein
MSITTSSGCTPNRMKIVYDFVKSRSTQGITRETLMAYLTPDSFNVGPSAVSDTISETSRLGLIFNDDDDKYRVAEDLVQDDRSFQEIIEDRLLRPSSPDKYGHQNFQKALAWFMLQSPTQPIDWRSNPRARVEADCGADINGFELTNDTRFNNFAYWARFLGFARMTPTGNAQRVTADPTEAVRRHLPKLLSPDATVAPVETLRKLALQLPVLDFGKTRVAIESLLPVDRQPDDTQISATMTLTLMRMEQAGEIILENRADAKSRIQLSPLTRLPTRTVISDMKVAS